MITSTWPAAITGALMVLHIGCHRGERVTLSNVDYQHAYRTLAEDPTSEYACLHAESYAPFGADSGEVSPRLLDKRRKRGIEVVDRVLASLEPFGQPDSVSETIQYLAFAQRDRQSATGAFGYRLDVNFERLGEFAERDREHWVAIVLAHELAHLEEMRTNKSRYPPRSFARELEADRLAGDYLARLELRKEDGVVWFDRRTPLVDQVISLYAHLDRARERTTHPEHTIRTGAFLRGYFKYYNEHTSSLPRSMKRTSSNYGRGLIEKYIDYEFDCFENNRCNASSRIELARLEPEATRASTRLKNAGFLGITGSLLTGATAGLVWGVTARDVSRGDITLARASRRFDTSNVMALSAVALAAAGLASLAISPALRTRPEWGSLCAEGMVVYGAARKKEGITKTSVHVDRKPTRMDSSRGMYRTILTVHGECFNGPQLDVVAPICLQAEIDQIKSSDFVYRCWTKEASPMIDMEIRDLGDGDVFFLKG